jgi:hypothetical protein
MATAMPYILLMQTIIETPAYLSDAKALGLTDAERTVIVDYIAQHPGAGEVMSGTGGARKVRFGDVAKARAGATGSSPSIRGRISRFSCSTSLPRVRRST